MTKKELRSLVVGALLSILSNGILYFLLFLETWDLFGTEEIIDPEGRHAKIFYASLAITTATLAATIFFLSLKRKFTAIGVALPTIVGCVILLKIGVLFLDKSNYYKEFSQRERLSGKGRLKVARKLVKDRVLIGLTLEDVKQKLGNADKEKFNDQEQLPADMKLMTYDIEERGIKLQIYFENNKALQAYLASPWFF